MAASFDFIIVGAGASGCVVASRLARTPSQPSVLILEAGGSNDSVSNLSGDERFKVAFSPNSPLNWNYKTAPQQQLEGQRIDYSRGKGLGGSTAINFCGWVVGPSDDYDEWGRLVEDESFSWQNAKRCLEKIENLHPAIPNPQLKKYVEAKVGDHSTTGSTALTYGESWIHDVGDIFVAAEQSNLPTNKDVNSGNPIGMGMGSVCIHKGQRVTAAIAYLAHPPNNLMILPNAPVARILFQGKRAVGVCTIDGRSFFAKKEVIISGGAINTPQILMLSGVGPQEELKKHGIPVIHDLPMLGKNFQDHCFSSVGIVMKESIVPTESPQPQSQSPTPMGWFKLDSILSSLEYVSLPDRVQRFLRTPSVPSIEIATPTPPNFLSYNVAPGFRFLGAMCLVMNPQSYGSITLESTDPTTAPHIDPKFVTHPFDRRVIIEGIRETMRLLSAPIYAAKTIEKVGPKDNSDEAIWNHVRHNLFSSWHMSCSARMGISSASACVNSQFRVFGLENTRVVDMSVCPFVPNTHTQSTAYVIGELAAEKLMEEYQLQACDRADTRL